MFFVIAANDDGLLDQLQLSVVKRLVEPWVQLHRFQALIRLDLLW